MLKLLSSSFDRAAEDEDEDVEKRNKLNEEKCKKAKKLIQIATVLFSISVT